MGGYNPAIKGLTDYKRAIEREQRGSNLFIIFHNPLLSPVRACRGGEAEGRLSISTYGG